MVGSRHRLEKLQNGVRANLRSESTSVFQPTRQDKTAPGINLFE
jgi:hypothetical protein